MADNKKQSLYDLLTTAEEKSSEIIDSAQQTIREARFSVDVVGCMRQTISALPGDDAFPAEEWDRQIAAWQDWHRSGSNLHLRG
jgi:hypothetical protein